MNYADPEAVPPVWEVGDVILDKYEVKEIFTGGGMGLVYRIYHRDWNIELAVKSPRAEYFETYTQKDNFIRECITWINLGLHPNIVNCHYVRNLGGIPRVFAEYVPSGSLKNCIESRELYEGGSEQALSRVLDIAIQMAWGLHYAHEEGLIHQDVKPANVLMGESWRAMVSDFGLAKARIATAENSISECRKDLFASYGGRTPAYCSPEQAHLAIQNQAGIPVEDQPKLTRGTDIWSWAVSVFEMFLGEPPCQYGQVAGEALDNYLTYREEIEQSLPTMPEDVVTLLRHCFRVDPMKRPQDLKSIADNLIEIFEQLPRPLTNAGHRVHIRSYPRQGPEKGDAHAGNLNNKAVSMHDLGKTDDARALLREALTVDPYLPEAYVNLALLTEGDESLRLLRQAVASSPGIAWPRAYLFNKADGYSRLEARFEALRLFPDDHELNHLLNQTQLPFAIVRVMGADETLQSHQRAKSIEREAEAAMTHHQWLNALGLYRQLLQLPGYHQNPKIVSRLRECAANTGQRIMPWQNCDSTVNQYDTEENGIGIDFGSQWIRAACVVPNGTLGSPARVEMMEIPAAVVITSAGRLRPVETYAELRRWAATLAEKRVNLNWTRDAGLDIFKAEEPCGDIHIAIMGISFAMGNQEGFAGLPVADSVTILDIAACLLSNVRCKILAQCGISSNVVSVSRTLQYYHSISAWTIAAEMAGFKRCRVVNVSGPVGLTLTAPDSSNCSERTVIVVHIEFDYISLTTLKIDDGVIQVVNSKMLAVDSIADYTCHEIKATAKATCEPIDDVFYRFDLLTSFDDYLIKATSSSQLTSSDQLKAILYSTSSLDVFDKSIEAALSNWFLSLNPFIQKWQSEDFPLSQIIVVGSLASGAWRLGISDKTDHLSGCGPISRKASMVLACGLAMEAGCMTGAISDTLLIDVLSYGISIGNGRISQQLKEQICGGTLPPAATLPTSASEICALCPLITSDLSIPAKKSVYFNKTLNQMQAWISVHETNNGDFHYDQKSNPLFESLFYLTEEDSKTGIEVSIAVDSRAHFGVDPVFEPAGA